MCLIYFLGVLALIGLAALFGGFFKFLLFCFVLYVLWRIIT